MPSLKEVAAKVNYLLTNGDDNADRKCHFGLIDVEVKERIANAGPKPKTRLVRELHSAEAYSDWNAEFSRYVEAAGDPNMAYSIMLRLLQQLPTSSIKRLAEDDPQPAGRSEEGKGKT